MDASGNVVAVWDAEMSTVPNRWVVYGTRFDVARQEWSTPVQISAEEQSQCFPNVAVDSEGNAIVVWNAFDYLPRGPVRWARFDGLTWSQPAQLNTFGANEPKVAVDGNGNAISVYGLTAVTPGLGSRRYSGGQWQTIPTISGGASALPQIAMNEAGIATAVWIDGTTVRGARYEIGATNWSSIATLSSGGAVPIVAPDIAIDPNGNAIAVWKEDDRIKAKRYDVVTGWDPTSQNLSDATSSSPHIAMDASGKALAVWTKEVQNEVDPSKVYNRIQASRYDATSQSWSTPVFLSNLGDDTDELNIAMDSAGNGVASWYRVFNGSQMIIQVAVYDQAAQTWILAQDVSFQDQSAWAPTVAMNAAGNAIVMWGFPGQGLEYNYAQLPSILELSTIILGPGNDFTMFVDGQGNVYVVTVVQVQTGVFNVVQYVYNVSTGQVQVNVVAQNVVQATGYTNVQGQNVVGYTTVQGVSFYVTAVGNVVKVSNVGQNVVNTNVVGAVSSAVVQQQQVVSYVQQVVRKKGYESIEDLVYKSNGPYDGLFTTIVDQDGIIQYNVEISPGPVGRYGFAMDGGNPCFVWELLETTPKIQAARVEFDGTNWIKKDTVDLSSNGANIPSVVAAGGGFYMFAWLENDGANDRVKAAYFQFDVGQEPQNWNIWDFAATTETLSPAGADAENPRFDLDDSSNATLLYEIEDTTFQRRFDAQNKEWEPVTKGMLRDLTHKTKALGSAFSASSGIASSYTGWTFRPIAGSALRNGLGDDQLLLDVEVVDPLGSASAFTIPLVDDPLPNVYNQNVTFGTNFTGQVNVVGYQVVQQQQQTKSNGSLNNDVIISVLAPRVVPQTPQNAYGRQEMHRYPLQCDLINVLRWDASLNAEWYEVYADANRQQLLAKIEPDCPLQYCHHCRVPSVSTTYYIYAVRSSGAYSSPAIITIPQQ